MPWFPDDHSWLDRPSPPPDEDARLAAEVVQRLGIDWTTRGQQIAVRVQNRVVILTGAVSGPTVRQAAAELAWDVIGVYDVCNALRLADGRRRR